MESLTSANTAFCLDLLKKFSDDDKTANIFYSPFSISSALAMVMLGACGDTHTQMSEGLKTQACQGEVHQSFGKLLPMIQNKDASYKLSVANRLYGEQSFEFVEEFLKNTKDYYHAELETVDFITNYEAARLNINAWVETQTNDKIKDLLADGVLDSLTRLVLVNAIYFKGSWKNKFPDKSTTDGVFKINKNDTKPVKMMHLKAKFPITRIPELGVQILELPYQGDDLSMLIFLPDENDSAGLEKLEKELNNENFAEWTRPDMMDKEEVQVSLPRFKLEETYDMKKVLVSMGMVDAFDPTKSNFSGMSKSNELSVSKVIHKAFVEVNEEGTEAAAATAGMMTLRCLPRFERFNADHPFLFFIQHKISKSILLAGRFCSPN